MGELGARGSVAPPRGNAKRVIALDRGVAQLRWRPDRHHGAKALYGCAALVGLATAVVTLGVDEDACWGLLVAAIFLGFGFLFGRANRVSRLDFTRRSLFCGRGKSATTIPFAKLVGILAYARIEVVNAGDTSQEVRRFVLGCVVADETDPIHARLQALRRTRKAVVCEGREPPAQKLSTRFEQQLRTRVLTLVDYPDETAVWQASEWLAKELDLPIVDACTSPTVLRVPEELDLSLGERLALGLQAIDERDEPTAAYSRVPAPPGASVAWQDGKCTLTWRHSRLFGTLTFLGLAAFFPGVGFAMAEDRSSFWVLVASGACFLPLAWAASHWHGVSQLTVDRKRVRVTRGPFGKRLRPFVTDRIEAIRVGGTSVNPLLTLVFDQRVLRIPMDPPLAHWAKRHIERHLRAVYAERLRLAR